jgi:hypothetical protein
LGVCWAVGREDAEGGIRVQRIIPIRIRNAETLAATDPIQIEEGALSLPLPLLGWLASFAAFEASMEVGPAEAEEVVIVPGV